MEKEKYKKPTLPFMALAMALLMKESQEVELAYNREGYKASNPFNDNQHLAEYLVLNNQNNKATLALRKVMKQVVQDDPILRAKYLTLIEKAKKLEEIEKNQGFSIDITGAGTKEQIIDSLQTIIVIIQGKTIKELQDGINIEVDNATCMKTDTFESYTGYSIEEDQE